MRKRELARKLADACEEELHLTHGFSLGAYGRQVSFGEIGATVTFTHVRKSDSVVEFDVEAFDEETGEILSYSVHFGHHGLPKDHATYRPKVHRFA